MEQNYSIEFRQPYLTAGQELQGDIFFTLIQDYKDAIIVIKFMGKEYSKILELFNVKIVNDIKISQDKKNPNKIPLEAKEKMNNIDISLGQDSQADINAKTNKHIQYIQNEQGALMRVVRNYGGRMINENQITIRQGKLGSGIHKIQFKFPTQEGWPSSHQWQMNTDSRKQKAQVRYYIKFSCQDNNNPTQNVQGLRDLIINAFIVPQIVERQISGDIVSWFCCLQGTVQMKCQLERDVFFPGEECVVRCEIDNTRCQQAVGPIKISILNKLVLIDESGYEKIISSVVSEKHFLGVEAGSSKINDSAIILKIKLPMSDLIPSTLGQFIQSKNYIRIEALSGHSNTQVRSKPIIQIPIKIQNAIRPQRSSSVLWQQAKAIETNGDSVQQNILQQPPLNSFKNPMIDSLPQQMKMIQTNNQVIELKEIKIK